MEIVVQRNEFMDQVVSLLAQAGFEGEDNKYTLEKIARQPGQTVIINGQRMEQPGREYKIIYDIEIVGDGCIENEDGSIDANFTQIRFSIGDQEYEECFRWDNFEWFNKVFNQIIR